MTEVQLSISTIGLRAREIFSRTSSISILGSTSKGVFLCCDDRWVIFLSYEPYHGPLTLNLSPVGETAFRIYPGQTVEIQNGSFVIPEANLRIKTEGANAWSVSPSPLSVLNPQDRNDRIRAVSHEIITQRAGIGLTTLLAELLHLPLHEQPPQPLSSYSMDIQELRAILKTSELSQVTARLNELIGLGSGLTPSGDDLISGFLLTSRRYLHVLPLPYDLNQLSQSVIELAYKKTSLLSANLIECASLGQADERLILALDGMLAGTLDPASCATLLLSWGNSSGSDALLGMALAAYQSA